MDEFTAHPERHGDLQFQKAARAVDVALSETIRYMSEEEAGHPAATTKDKLSVFWQAASRAVAPLDPEFAEACYYKALGWLRPGEWEKAAELGVKTDLEFIRDERIKLIKSARLEPAAISQPRLTQWITDKEHRERLTFVGGGLAVLIGALWTGFVYFDGKSWVRGTPSTVDIALVTNKAMHFRPRAQPPPDPTASNAPTTWLDSPLTITTQVSYSSRDTASPQAQVLEEDLLLQAGAIAAEYRWTYVVEFKDEGPCGSDWLCVKQPIETANIEPGLVSQSREVMFFPTGSTAVSWRQFIDLILASNGPQAATVTISSQIFAPLTRGDRQSSLRYVCTIDVAAYRREFLKKGFIAGRDPRPTFFAPDCQ
jgi:hypothetical protein